MSKPTQMPPADPFQSIDLAQLEQVSGGASRVSSRAGGADDQLVAMLTQVTDSIKQLSSKGSGSDPMQMMMMMMMGGRGGGGGAAAAPAAAAPPPAPIINVTTKRY